jgi:hypothetical protein
MSSMIAGVVMSPAFRMNTKIDAGGLSRASASAGAGGHD